MCACMYVMRVHLRARTCDGRAPPSSLPRPSVGPHVRERVSKRVSSTCSLARCSVSRKPREGTNGRGRSSDSHSNSRLSSNLGRVTLARRGSIAHKYRGGHGDDDGEGSVGVGSVGPSFGRSGSGGEKRNLPPSASRPPARPSPGNLRQLGPKVGGAVTILRRRCDCEGKER